MAKGTSPASDVLSLSSLAKIGTEIGVFSCQDNSRKNGYKGHSQGFWKW